MSSPPCGGAQGGAGSDRPADDPWPPVGEVPQWEWCRIVGQALGGRSFSELPEADWGVYGEEDNARIEEAFQRGDRDCEVNVGIREYTVHFDGRAVQDRDFRLGSATSTPSYSVQWDLKMGKVRAVRRHLLPIASRQARLEATAEQSREAGAAGECCALCQDVFAETPWIPTLRLRECGHEFHCACAQGLADRRGECPLCRSSADWRDLALLSRLPESRGGCVPPANPTKDPAEKELIESAYEGDLAEVQRLLEGRADVNAGSARRATPLIEAAVEGHLPVVEALLAARANIHMATSTGVTAIIGAACMGQEQVAELLLRSGADPHTPNDAGRSAVDAMPELVRTWERRWAERRMPRGPGGSAELRRPSDRQHEAPARGADAGTDAAAILLPSASMPTPTPTPVSGGFGTGSAAASSSLQRGVAAAAPGGFGTGSAAASSSRPPEDVMRMQGGEPCRQM